MNLSGLQRIFGSRPWTHRPLCTNRPLWSAQQLPGYEGPSPLYQFQPEGYLSFLNTLPISLESPTILGQLSPEGRFEENGSFIDLVHTVFSAAYLNDAHVCDLALSRKASAVDSYVHVLGTRTKTAVINERDPTSIIFSFLAHSTTGLPVPDTYEPNPALRLYTPLDGFLVFPNSLHSALVRGCQIARQVEENPQK